MALALTHYVKLMDLLKNPIGHLQPKSFKSYEVWQYTVPKPVEMESWNTGIFQRSLYNLKRWGAKKIYWKENPFKFIWPFAERFGLGKLTGCMSESESDVSTQVQNSRDLTHNVPTKHPQLELLAYLNAQTCLHIWFCQSECVIMIVHQEYPAFKLAVICRDLAYN